MNTPRISWADIKEEEIIEPKNNIKVFDNKQKIVKIVGNGRLPDKILNEFVKLENGSKKEVEYGSDDTKSKYVMTKTTNGKYGDFCWHIKFGKVIRPEKRVKIVLEILEQKKIILTNNIIPVIIEDKIKEKENQNIFDSLELD